MTMHHLHDIPDTGAAIAVVNAAHAAGIIGTDTRTVRIPACDEHQGFYGLTLTLTWRCMYCGAPRGEPFETLSYDGSRRLGVHGWENPCGHVEKYSAIRKLLKETA
ncbi:hypothetical protein KIF53_15620 [Chromobacterium subtsugae]|uniref:Uncharacterized protein n=1 Tax=Chromobacterium subtsugae TaxID=251747 RepID=A0ABS7FG73_9NEIS|nr:MULTISPECIES: hypothetical protein [Chromobacterium]MBW7567835.1 hypothetical protein [Chromobacterium subtsugae]MBW8289062.1 hypothetical protein [Chromobacterium subtsugae]WSE93793.1 hypothetical protein U6115_11275 [Chromobacterium subtsugae]WVH62170.1 hypothetical protein U6151_11295 [Chromobacterium subtsugae]